MRRSPIRSEAGRPPDRPADAASRADDRGSHAPLGLLAVAGAIVSVAAAVVAVGASWRSRHSQSGVAVEVVDGNVHRDLASDLRRYAFTVKLTNRSSIARTIAAAGIRVSYRTRANFLGAVDLPLTPSDDEAALRTPLRLPPGEAVRAIAQLETSNIIPRHCRIEGYSLLLVDSSGERQAAPMSLPQVLKNDHDGDGPRTWGWD